MVNILDKFLSEFAKRIKCVDSKSKHINPKYGKGIGPFSEPQTIKKVLSEFPAGWNGCKFKQEVDYTSGERCDLCIETDNQKKLFIEIKMMRLKRANGGIENNNIAHILSPYSKHRSALTDIQKLRDSRFKGDKAIVIYGYDYDEYPMSILINCFEKLAGSQLESPKYSYYFKDLVHDIHKRGQVHGWMLS